MWRIFIFLLLASYGIAQSSFCPRVGPGVAGFYRFEGPSIWQDSVTLGCCSPVNYTNSASVGSPARGYASIYRTTADSRIVLTPQGNSGLSSQPLVMSLWVRMVAFRDYSGLFTQRGTTFDGLAFSSSGSGLSSSTLQGRGVEVVTVPGVPLPIGEWHHIAIISDTKMMRIFVDGFCVASQGFGPVTRIHNDYFVIGNDDFSFSARYLDAVLDEAILKTGSFGSDEVSSLMRGAWKTCQNNNTTSLENEKGDLTSL